MEPHLIIVFIEYRLAFFVLGLTTVVLCVCTPGLQ